MDTIQYKFTAIPTNLFLCLDNNCRSVLFTLIQLSTYYENAHPNSDGWFYRSNADLMAETSLSYNVLGGALDALYQKGIIGIICQQKGKGKYQETRKYKVFYESFLKYESISIEDCYKVPDYAICTLDYKSGPPSFQRDSLPTSQLGSQPTSQLNSQLMIRKSENNIYNIDNTDNTDNGDNKENIDNKEDILININLLNNRNFSVETDTGLESNVNDSELEDSNAKEREETEKEKEQSDIASIVIEPHETNAIEGSRNQLFKSEDINPHSAYQYNISSPLPSKSSETEPHYETPDEFISNLLIEDDFDDGCGYVDANVKDRYDRIVSDINKGLRRRMLEA